MLSKMSNFLWMTLLTKTTRYEQACVQISPESQWYVLDPRFPQDREVIVWIKISLEIDGHCWGTAPTCTEIPPSKILLVSNNHPPHININRLVWKPKHWQAHVNYRFWSGWVVPRRWKRPRWGKTGGSTARRPPRMFFILYDRAPVCTRQLQITNRRTNKACWRRLQLIMGWAVGTQPKYHAYLMYPSRNIQMLWTARLQVLLLLCPLCSSRMFTIWLRSFSSLLVATIISRINASTLKHIS